MDNWTEVKDGNPILGEYVLLLLEGQTMLKGRLCNNGWSAFFADGEKSTGTREVTHWMLLPALPGEEKINKPNITREQAALAAMQGLLSNSHPEVIKLNNIAYCAVAHADDLLTELSKPQP